MKKIIVETLFVHALNNENKSLLEYWALNIQFVMYITLNLLKIDIMFWIKITIAKTVCGLNGQLILVCKIGLILHRANLCTGQNFIVIAPLNGSRGPK